MSAPVWWVGDQEPVIGDQITRNEVGVDLSAIECQFRMRAPGSSDLKVDSAVTTKDSSGNWTYAWEYDDLDTPGMWLVWVEVDYGGTPQTLWEALIEVRAHGDSHQYAELEIVKSDLNLLGTTHADATILAQIEAVSRGIEVACGRRFWLDADNTSVRYYRALSHTLAWIDDVVDVQEVAIKEKTGPWSTAWTPDDDYVLEPLNAAADDKPWWWLYAVGAKRFPRGNQGQVRVTGQFGWPAVPKGVNTATALVATKLYKRAREAPFGIVTFGTEAGVAMRRLTEIDPDVEFLLNGLIRKKPF